MNKIVLIITISAFALFGFAACNSSSSNSDATDTLTILGAGT